MNCHEISRMLAEGAIDREAISAHLLACAECRQRVEFDQWLGQTIAEAPPLNPEVIDRVRLRTSQPNPRGLLSRKLDQGALIMKKTLWTTAMAAALAIGAFVVLSSTAVASTPKAKFGAMKKALALKQDRTMISMTVEGGPDGKPKMKVMINGQLVDVPEGTPFEFHDGNKKVIISAKTNFDDLTPEERARIEKMIEETIKGEGGGPEGSVSKTVIIDGKTYTGANADRAIKEHGIKIDAGAGVFQGGTDIGGVWIDVSGEEFTLNEADYSNIKFGSDENTLFLTPKKGKDVRYALKVDPKTNLPYTVTLQKSKDGKWTTVNSSKFQYKPKAKSPKIKV